MIELENGEECWVHKDRLELVEDTPDKLTGLSKGSMVIISEGSEHPYQTKAPGIQQQGYHINANIQANNGFNQHIRIIEAPGPDIILVPGGRVRRAAIGTSFFRRADQFFTVGAKQGLSFFCRHKMDGIAIKYNYLIWVLFRNEKFFPRSRKRQILHRRHT